MATAVWRQWRHTRQQKEAAAGCRGVVRYRGLRGGQREAAAPVLVLVMYQSGSTSTSPGVLVLVSNNISIISTTRTSTRGLVLLVRVTKAALLQSRRSTQLPVLVLLSAGSTDTSIKDIASTTSSSSTSSTDYQYRQVPPSQAPSTHVSTGSTGSLVLVLVLVMIVQYYYQYSAEN
jgi:hypothetical protein